MIKLVLARHREGNIKLMELLDKSKIEIIAIDTIYFEPLKNWRKIDIELKRINEYDWIIITSTIGASFLINHIKEKNFQNVKNAKFATVGKKTAEILIENGFNVCFIPSEFTTEKLAKEIPFGEKVLLLRSDIASKKMLEILSKRGMKVKNLVLYRTRINDKKLEIKDIDAIVFGSPSEVEGFIRCVRNYKQFLDKKVFSIGPVTAKKAYSYGFKDITIPKEYTFKSLADCINEWANGYCLS